MKATIRIPTVQFGYIEFQDVEAPTTDDIITIHNELVARYKSSSLTEENW